MPHDMPQLRVGEGLQALGEDTEADEAAILSRRGAHGHSDVPQASAHPTPWTAYPIGRNCTSMKVHDATGRMVFQAPATVVRQVIEAMNA